MFISDAALWTLVYESNFVPFAPLAPKPAHSDLTTTSASHCIASNNDNNKPSMRTKNNDLKAIQDSNVYTLARRSRAHQLDTLGQKKLTAALSQTSSPYGWLYTSCC
jgi:hypothetical protein